MINNNTADAMKKFYENLQAKNAAKTPTTLTSATGEKKQPAADIQPQPITASKTPAINVQAQTPQPVQAPATTPPPPAPAPPVKPIKAPRPQPATASNGQPLSNKTLTDLFGQIPARKYKTLEEVAAAAARGETIDISNVTEILASLTQQQSKLCTPVPVTSAAPAKQAQPATQTKIAAVIDIQVIEYTPKCIVLTGEGTKALKEEIKKLGGKPSYYLKDISFGWIFPKTREAQVRKVLNL